MCREGQTGRDAERRGGLFYVMGQMPSLMSQSASQAVGSEEQAFSPVTLVFHIVAEIEQGPCETLQVGEAKATFRRPA